MSEERRPAPETSSAHEMRDADVRKLVWMGVGLLALIVFGFIVTEGAFYFFTGQLPIKRPTALFTRQQMPPPPLLQEHPGGELDTYLAQQEKTLNTYGWVDRKTGIVRIPIDQAMNVLLQKGLPVRPAGQVTPGVSAPHEIPRGDFGPPPVGVKGPQKQ
ncbi:MAG: hypothetical protein ACRD2G_08710 [Terriglobia bacterium]